MIITTDQVKALRNETGISVMQCKQALEEANGDFKKAKVILQKKGTAVAKKKGDRELKAGTVEGYIHSNNEVGTLVLLSCETDFVSKNEEFKELARNIAMHAAASSPEFISRSDVTPEKLKTAKSVFMYEVKDKPEKVREKIVEGKINSYLSEKVLLEQAYIKDPEVTIQDLLDSATQKFGERVEVSKCVRVSIHD